MPSSSQPPIGDVIEAFERAQGNDVLSICMADGLSGTYETATMLVNKCQKKKEFMF